MLISLCIITKNESQNLASCIGSVCEIVDELIVVDTGSSDDTQNIAQRLGATLLVHGFNDDFSEIRNFSLQHATKEWVLILDADEIVDEASLHTLRELAQGSDPEVSGYYLWRHNYFGDGYFNTFEILRFFRNRPEIYFERLVHETVKSSIDRQMGTVESCNVVIHHFPFRKKGRFAEKSDLYLRLLRKQSSLTPTDTLCSIFLALEYAARRPKTSPSDPPQNAETAPSSVLQFSSGVSSSPGFWF